MMAAKFMQLPPPVTRVGCVSPPNAGKLMAVMRADGVYSGRLHLRSKSSIRFGYYSSGFKPIRVSEQGSELLGDEDDDDDDEAKMEASHPRTPTQIKEDLYKALEGINRGIFGVTSEKKLEIEELVNILESMNPFPEPTKSMDKVAGRWKVVYSTVKILGRKRTKLGLRGFVSLGDILQTVNVPEEKSVDLFKFNLKGMDFLNGHLKIESSFTIASESRVDLKYEKSTVAPDQLLNVFRKKYDTLLSIFNPEGWHEITYLDETLRIGRDDKGNIFVLERYEEVVDTSGGCGASFVVEVVSPQFEGKRLLERHRIVNAALAEEMKEIHALSIKKTLTPEQWKQQQESEKPQSAAA